MKAEDNLMNHLGDLYKQSAPQPQANPFGMFQNMGQPQGNPMMANPFAGNMPSGISAPANPAPTSAPLPATD